MAHSDNSGFGVSHLADLPVTVTFAIVIAAALVALALLRHFSVKVEA